jgi:adenine deaminase
VDWNPTGSDTNFDELRVASSVNTTTFGGAIDGADWLPMITHNPAKALALEDVIGSLGQGFKADITVVTQQDGDASLNLLKSHLADVQMVWVGGQLLYGDKTVVETVRPNACEPFVIKGVEKRLCVADPDSHVPKHEETLDTLTHMLLQKYPQLAPLTR